MLIFREGIFLRTFIFFRTRIFLLTLLIFFIIPRNSHAQTQDLNNQSRQSLSIQECIILALNNHPSLRSSKANIKSIEAQLEQIRVSNRMTVDINGSLNYNGDYKNFSDSYHSEGLSVTASKLLYDTGRNKLQQEIQNENLYGTLETDQNTRVTVAANAKRAYYELVLKILNADVEREKLANLEKHLENARGLYEVGNSAMIEITKAQSDVASAKVSLLKAENDISISQEALRVAMGIEFESAFNISLSTKLLLPSSVSNVDELISTALNDRPDYKKLAHDMKSNELSIKNAARTSSPTINGSIGSSVSKSEGNTETTDYNFGVSINIPVVDGGAKNAALKSAYAQRDQTNAEADALRHGIIYSVRSAVLSLSNAIDRVKSSELSVRYAEENLKLAQGRYEVGVGDPIELSDAVSDLASARYTFYQALYDSQTARADLDEALGHLPIEITEGDLLNNVKD